MESSQEENVVNFSGNVEARQNDLTILADRMTVHYAAGAPANAAGIRAVQSIKAEGNVRMKRKDWAASSDQMEYDEKDHKVVLLGHSKVWQNNNMVTGDKVEVFLDEGKSVVERGKKKSERVKAFFYPQATGPASAGKGKKGKNKDGAAAGR